MKINNIVWFEIPHCADAPFGMTIAPCETKGGGRSGGGQSFLASLETGLPPLLPPPIPWI